MEIPVIVIPIMLVIFIEVSKVSLIWDVAIWPALKGTIISIPITIKFIISSKRGCVNLKIVQDDNATYIMGKIGAINSANSQRRGGNESGFILVIM